VCALRHLGLALSPTIPAAQLQPRPNGALHIDLGTRQPLHGVLGTNPGSASSPAFFELNASCTVAVGPRHCQMGAWCRTRGGRAGNPPAGLHPQPRAQPGHVCTRGCRTPEAAGLPGRAQTPSDASQEHPPRRAAEVGPQGRGSSCARPRLRGLHGAACSACGSGCGVRAPCLALVLA